MKKKEKTNVMRVLDSKKIKYNEYYYGDTEAVSGVDVVGLWDRILKMYLKHW